MNILFIPFFLNDLNQAKKSFTHLLSFFPYFVFVKAAVKDELITFLDIVDVAYYHQ